jgi:hypothetical protein
MVGFYTKTHKDACKCSTSSFRPGNKTNKTQKIRRPGRGVLTSPCRAPKTQTAGWCGGLMWQEAQSCNKVSDLRVFLRHPAGLAIQLCWPKPVVSDFGLCATDAREPRQVRKEATVASLSVCRRTPEVWHHRF